jgi:uncharacterized protein (DUF302 family)
MRSTVRNVSDYGYAVEVAEGYDEAVLRARLALKGEGFSIITEMHVGGLLGPDSGEGRQYLFMGAWAQASPDTLSDGLQVAVHIPCNVVVQEATNGAIVAALDPASEIDPSDDGFVRGSAAAREALERAFRRLEEQL